MSRIFILYFISNSICLFSQNNKTDQNFYKYSQDEVQFQKLKLDKLGFVFSSFDSIQDSTGQLTHYNVSKEIKIDSLILIIHSSDLSNVKSIKFNNLKVLNKYLSKTLNQYQINGYIKANYFLDTFYFSNSNFTIHYNINLGKKFIIDSVRCVDVQKSLNHEYVQRIVNSDKKKYGEFQYSRILDLIKYIDFIEIERSPDFSILDSSVILNLYVKERKLNQVNATIGILSNANISKSVLITGDAQLSLFNLFKKGIELNINWQKNDVNNQFLFVKSSIPFVFKSSFGINNSFSIEKFDTLYQRIQNQIGIEYFISHVQSISFLYKYQSSQIEGIDEFKIKQGILPLSLDYTFQQFGLGYKISRLDKPLFTKKGFKIEANFLFGNKSIEKNNNISKLIDAQGNSLIRLYDSITLSQSIATIQFTASRYTQLIENLILKSSVNAKGNFSENIGLNEMYNIGGLRYPRGFNDNSLITPNFIVFSNDLQYYLADYFYSNIFADITFMQNSLTPYNLVNPIGFGIGLSFQTSNSILQLNIGNSISENNGISFSNSKVHIQYTNVF